MQDGANVVDIVAGILDLAAAVAKEVFVVVAEEVVGHDFHDPGRDFVHGTVSWELVLKNPMI